MVVQSFDGDDVVQVTVDPEGTVFVARDGRTTRTEVPRADVRDLARLVDSARLDELGSNPAKPGEVRHGLLAGDTEVYRAASDVPARLRPVIDCVLERAPLARP